MKKTWRRSTDGIVERILAGRRRSRRGGDYFNFGGTHWSGIDI